MSLITFLKSCLSSVDFDTVTTVEAKTCRSFEELLGTYRKGMTVTPSLEDCMAVCLAVHLAVKFDGDPLWIYLVGAPSSGKSTLCELLSADEYNTRSLSKFTGLVSGSRQGAHLIPKLHNKCVVIKDGTLLLESTPVQLANVYGELRDIFDGSLEAHYRNGVSASFSNISFGMIVGITERIYSLNMSALGERFLHCRLETDRVTEVSRNAIAIDAIFTNTSRTIAEGSDAPDQRAFSDQRGYTAGFLNHVHNRITFEDIVRPQYTAKDKSLIQSLADIVACSRAQAPKDTKDKILYDSRPESSTRVVKQLARLALSLCYVYNVKNITEQIRRLITKVAIDTAHSRQYHVVRVVALSAQGLTRPGVASACRIPLETSRGIIEDLLSLEILSENSDHERVGSGRKNKVLISPEWIRKAFSHVENTPSNTDTENQSVSYKSPRSTKNQPIKRIRTRTR